METIELGRTEHSIAVGVSFEMGEGESVKVVARFRPFNAKELTLGNVRESQETIELKDSAVEIHHPAHPNLEFSLNKVFDTSATQEDVYGQFGKEAVSQMMEGFNVTMFAYGQTGSGKSYSMLGDVDSEEKAGIIPRICRDMFEQIQDASELNPGIEFTVACSYLEVYQEEIKDLLTRNQKRLAIRESPSQGVYVENLTTEYVGSPDDIYDLLAIGDRMRKVASTNMNQRSSRSHTCFITKIIQRDEHASTKEAKLNLVDLAGSERIKKTGATGQTLEEAKKINLSLTCLSHCINALTDPHKSHVPFRGSKLTRLLQESLGGNSKTTVLVAASPHVDNLDETICTLRFADRCKRVTNTAKENIQLSPAQLTKMCQKLTDDLANLKLYTMSLEGVLKRLGIDPSAVEDGKLDIDAKRPKTVHQTVDKETQITPRGNGQNEDLITTYENQSVIVPSQEVLKRKALNDLPPPGQTYITSTVSLKAYNLDTFGEKEQSKFCQGIADAMENEEIDISKIRILEMTAGSVIVTFRVEAPNFLAANVSETVNGKSLGAKLEAAGINAKGMSVVKAPAIQKGTVRPKDLEEQKRVDGMPSTEFFDMDTVKLVQETSRESKGREELDQLSNQILELKAENEALESQSADVQRELEDAQMEGEQAQVQIDALGEMVRMLKHKLVNSQPLSPRTLEKLAAHEGSAPKLAGGEVISVMEQGAGERENIVVPEPSKSDKGRGQKGSIADRTPKFKQHRRGASAVGSSVIAPTAAVRKSRKVESIALKNQDLDETDSNPTTGRRVPQLFVPMDAAQIEGEYRTFVANEYSEPPVPRRRDEDEFDAQAKVKELQVALDRQTDIIERQSILLAHQDKSNKSISEELNQLRQDKSVLEAKLSEYEMRLLEAVREVQPGLTSKDYRGMGYGGHDRPKNIRMPVRTGDSILGQSARSARSARATVRTSRTKTSKDGGPGMMSGVFSMISDILELEKEDEGDGGDSGKMPSTPSGKKAKLDLRRKARDERAKNVERPESPTRSDKFNVGKMFGF